MAKQTASPEEKISSHRLLKFLGYIAVLFVSFFILKALFGILTESLVLSSVKVEIDNREMSLPDANSYLDRVEMKNVKTPETIKTVKKIRSYLEKKYPSPVSLPSLIRKGTYEGVKNRAVIVYMVELFLLLSMIVVFIIYDKKKLEPFFYRLPFKDEPIKVGDNYRFLDLRYLRIGKDIIESVFGNYERYVTLFKVWDTTIISDVRIYKKEDRKKVRPNDVVIDFIEINKDIRRITDELLIYGRRNGFLSYDRTEEERFRLTIALSLFHFISGFFGNMPSGFISPYLKDFSTKRFLSSYMFAKVNNTEFLGIEKEREKEPHLWLFTFNGFRKEKRDFMRKLKDKYMQVPDLIPLKEVK